MGGFIRGVSWIAYLVMTTEVITSCGDYSTGQSTFDELNTNDNIIIVDSIPLTHSIVYWFCIDLGIKGYSTGRVGLAKSKSDLTEDYELLAISDGITDIGMVNDTLELYLLEGYGLEEKEIKEPDVNYMKVIPDDNHQGLIINRIEGNIEFPTQDIDRVNKR